MPLYELAALGAATCWALTGIISAGPANHLGALAFNRARQVFVTGLLALYVLASGTWRELDAGAVGPLLLSGFIGIFIGDTLLFATLNRVGPRRSGPVRLGSVVSGTLRNNVLTREHPTSTYAIDRHPLCFISVRNRETDAMLFRKGGSGNRN